MQYLVRSVGSASGSDPCVSPPPPKKKIPAHAIYVLLRVTSNTRKGGMYRYKIR